VDRWTSFLVDMYIVQTEYAKKELIRILSIQQEKVVVIPNGITGNHFQKSVDIPRKKRELSIPSNDLIVTCVANLKAGKGYEELLAAFEQVYQNIKTIHLLIVGDGNQLQAYQEQCKAYASRKNIHFLGKRTDVQALLAISDIFVLATYSEGMSNAILEAMASKLPVITTNIEVNKEIITDRVSGILLPPRESSSLAKEILYLAKDASARISLGTEAYKAIEKTFEIKKVIPRIQHTYELLLYGR